MIKNLSPSRASQFKTCPKQFKFANVDKLKEEVTNLEMSDIDQKIKDFQNKIDGFKNKNQDSPE